MHALIEKLLKKNKIGSLGDLSSDEKETFDRWERILSEGEMTTDRVADFCRNQLRIVDAKMKQLDNTTLTNERLVMLHTVYKGIFEAIIGPKKERESLERYLNSLLT